MAGIRTFFESAGNFRSGTAQKIKAVIITKADKIIKGAKNQLIGIKKWGMLYRIPRTYRFI